MALGAEPLPPQQLAHILCLHPDVEATIRHEGDKAQQEHEQIDRQNLSSTQTRQHRQIKHNTRGI
jgi:hypothetical protein